MYQVCMTSANRPVTRTCFVEIDPPSGRCRPNSIKFTPSDHQRAAVDIVVAAQRGVALRLRRQLIAVVVCAGHGRVPR
jgi:hypothetical protein